MMACCLCFAGCKNDDTKEEAKADVETVEEKSEEAPEEKVEEATETEKEDLGAAGYGSFKESEIESLINSYYDAYSAGDIDTIKKLAINVSDKEASYIQMISEYYDKAHIEKLIYSDGADENAVCVGVICEIKFSEVEKEAPGLDFFYIERIDDKLVIDSTYCAFNSTYQAIPVDDKIQECIDDYVADEDFLALSMEVDERYSTFVEGYPEYNEFIEGTLTDALIEWNDQYNN